MRVPDSSLSIAAHPRQFMKQKTANKAKALRERLDSTRVARVRLEIYEWQYVGRHFIGRSCAGEGPVRPALTVSARHPDRSRSGACWRLCASADCARSAARMARAATVRCSRTGQFKCLFHVRSWLKGLHIKPDKRSREIRPTKDEFSIHACEHHVCRVPNIESA